MNTTPTDVEQITFGGPEFWKIYDELCEPENLRKLVEDDEFPLAERLHRITKAAHLTRAIHILTRPERGWTYHKAWLSLKTVTIQKHDGNYATTMRSGDIVVVEHGWDRDVIITHCPIERNMVSGYLLSGKWEPMIGLFLPLFDKATIMTCIDLRMEQNVADAKELADEEARDWNWFV